MQKEIFIYAPSFCGFMKQLRVFLSITSLLLSLLLTSSGKGITGAVVGVGYSPGMRSAAAGILLLIASIVLFLSAIEKDDLGVIVNSHWRKYSPNKESVIGDMEQEYLWESKPGQKTEKQKEIEKEVTGGKLIDDETRNKKPSYEEQFYEGHAAGGGRVIDVESHIARKGKNKGKLVHFDQPANARYLWVIDEDGNFIIANRRTMLHDMPKMRKDKIDLLHRRHKRPHPTIAKGKEVYGSGEVLIEGGLVKSFNTASGHYIDLKNPEEFDRQGEEVFRHFMKKAGWKEVKGRAKYRQVY